MFAKKLLQFRYIKNINIIPKKYLEKNIINIISKNITTNLNLNYSHHPNALPIEPIRTVKKLEQNNQNQNLIHDTILKDSNNFSDSVSYSEIKKNLTRDFEQIFNYKNSFSVTPEISSLADSIKILGPDYINEFVDEILKDNKLKIYTFAEIEEKINEFNDKIFLGEYGNRKEDIEEIISFTLSIIKYFCENKFYNNRTHVVNQDTNKIYNLKKIDSIRNIYENINFEKLTNENFIQLLPSIIILCRIFNFSSLITNSFNTAVNRLLFSENFFLDEFSGNKDDKILLIFKNRDLLLSYIKNIFFNYGNYIFFDATNINNVFPNMQILLSKIIYLKDILIVNSDLNEILYLFIENILNYNYSFEELDKLRNSKKLSAEKLKDFQELFRESFISFSNYLLQISYQKPNFIKKIDLNLLKMFTNSLIMLIKSETEYPSFSILKNNPDIKLFISNFVQEFYIKLIFSKQTILYDYITKVEGALSLLELTQILNIKNFDSNISEKKMLPFLIENPFLGDLRIIDFLTYSARKFDCNRITRLMMNMVFTGKKTNIFKNLNLDIISEYLLYLEKFQVLAVSNYYEEIKSEINLVLHNININTHLNFLYLITRLNLDFSLSKSPLYVTFLLKINENLTKDYLEKDAVKLAWTLAYYCTLDSSMNVAFDQSVKNLINYLRQNSDWVNLDDVQGILDILMMINHLKTINLKIPNYIVNFFDKEVVGNLLNFYYVNTINNSDLDTILTIIRNDKNILFQLKKNTNLFYIDLILQFFNKEYPIIVVSDADYNSYGNLKAHIIIRKNHFEEYFKTKVILVNVEKIKTIEELKNLLN